MLILYDMVIILGFIHSLFFFVSMQFDLQRMMIYCDSKHAELETCCDLPNGPVSLWGSVSHEKYDLFGHPLYTFVSW